MTNSATSKLQSLLERPGILSFPCCYDAISAQLIERAGFPLTFMSGFAVSAVRLGMPDAGLISYGEMLDQGRNICAAVQGSRPSSRADGRKFESAIQFTRKLPCLGSGTPSAMQPRLIGCERHSDDRRRRR